jgi:hypothetical protein
MTTPSSDISIMRTKLSSKPHPLRDYKRRVTGTNTLSSGKQASHTHEASSGPWFFDALFRDHQRYTGGGEKSAAGIAVPRRREGRTMRYATTIATIFALSLSAATLTGCPLRQPNACLQFYNDSSGDYVKEIYLCSAGDDDWGGNLISEQIPPGSSIPIEDLYPGTYSIKVGYLDPSAETQVWIEDGLELIRQEAVHYHFTGSD